MQKYKKGDFFHFPNKSILRGLDAKAQIVFMWLSSYADEDGVCFPSRRTLANDTGIKSSRTIDKAIKVLEEIGLITKENRFKEKEQKSNLYQINNLGGSAKIAQGGRAKIAPPRAKIAQGVEQKLLTELNPIELTSLKRGDSPKNYLEKIPNEDLEAWVKKYRCSRKQIQTLATKLKLGLVSKGINKNDYKAYLLSKIIEDFPEREIKNNLLPKIKKEERTPEQQRKIDNMLEEIRKKQRFKKHGN